MAAIYCEVGTGGTYSDDFQFFIPVSGVMTEHWCASDSPPFVVMTTDGMTRDEYLELSQLCLLLFMIAFGLRSVARVIWRRA